jgi:hypothetical protein
MLGLLEVAAAAAWWHCGSSCIKGGKTVSAGHKSSECSATRKCGCRALQKQARGVSLFLFF